MCYDEHKKQLSCERHHFAHLQRCYRSMENSNQRLKSIEIRKDLTDQWKLHNVEEGIQYATLTDIIYQHWAGKTAKEYKKFKGLKKENLRDNMTNEELVLNMLAELSTTSITKSKNPQTLENNRVLFMRLLGGFVGLATLILLFFALF